MSAVELLELAKSLTDSNDRQGRKILGYLEKKIQVARTKYINSPQFKTRVSQAISLIKQHPEKKFKYISEILHLLKSNKESVKVNDSNGKTSQSTDVEVASVEPVSQRKLAAIKRLEAMMEAYHKEIKRYEEKELTLDEMDSIDTTYLTTERLKKRCFKIHQRICELGDYDRNSLGGLRQKNVKYNGSRYKELNYHITKMINRSTDSEERMPDYHDVVKIVKKCNAKYNYSLSASRIRDLGKEIFIKIGSDIQNLRKNDFVSDFGHTDTINSLLRQNTGFEDPALTDAVLRRQLEENRKAGDTNLSNLFEQFAREQDDVVLAAAAAKSAETYGANEVEKSSGSGDSSTTEESDSSDSSESEEDVDGLEEGLDEEMGIEISESPPGARAAAADGDSNNSESSSRSSQSSKIGELDNVELSSLDEASDVDDDDVGGEQEAMEHEVLGHEHFTNCILKEAGSEVRVPPVPQPEVIELSDSD